jgi:hypothetical protein
MPATTTAKPVLDLGSLEPVRSFIRVDGVEYRYRADMDLNLVDLARIERARDEIAGIRSEADGKATPEQAERLGELISEGVGLIMFDPIPPEVMAKLNDIQRLGILDAFTRATLRAALQKSSKARAAARTRAGRSTSPTSSHGSSASTRRRGRRSG